jgi:hypothetical protein
LKRINAYGGRVMLWRGDGEWCYDFRVRRKHKRTLSTLTTADGTPLYFSIYGAGGFGQADSMRAARRHGVRALRHAK